MTLREIVTLIERRVRPVRTEEVSVISALGRIAAHEVHAGKAMPPFDVSGLDGYALKGTGDRFVLRGHVDPLMEDMPIHLKKGETVFIATGAPFPKRTRFVAREHARELGEQIVVQTGADERRVITKGDWLKKGEKLVGKGEAVTPSAMARLALAGHTALPVYRKPAVAIVTTGSELKKGRMIDSNAFLLAGLIEGDGGELVRRDIADDREEEIREKIGEIGADLLIMTGGTSKGKKDLTKRSLAAAGARFYLESPPISPGRTMAFGKKGSTCCFVLPGNPHAIRTLYELFIKKTLHKLAGRLEREETEYKIAMPEGMKKPQDTIMAIPVWLTFAPERIAQLYPEEPNAIVVLDEGERVPAGKKVKVLPL